MQYTALDEDQQHAILMDRIREVECEHYVATLNLLEIEGTADLYPDGDHEEAAKDLSAKIEVSAIRVENLRRLLPVADEE